MFKRHACVLAALILMAIIGFAYPMMGAARVKAQGGGPNTGPAAPAALAPAAPVGAMYQAVVNADGTLARGVNVLSSMNVGAVGAYQVVFRNPIRTCTYVATIGLAGSSGEERPGQISVVGRVTTVNGVFVQTTDSTGTPSDRGFHLLVAC